MHSFSCKVRQVEKASVSKPSVNRLTMHLPIFMALVNMSRIKEAFRSFTLILSRVLKEKFKYKSKVEIGGLNLFKKASDLKFNFSFVKNLSAHKLPITWISSLSLVIKEWSLILWENK